jgi:hypothetical protein
MRSSQTEQSIVARLIVVIVVALAIPVSVRPQEMVGRPAEATSGGLALRTVEPVPPGQQSPHPEIKSQALALSFSMIVPGLGQVYNGQVDKGIVFATLFWGGVYMVDAAKIGQTHESITAFGWLSVGYLATVYVWNILDAAFTAKRINEVGEPGVSLSPVLTPAPGTRAYSGGLQLTIRL